MGDIVFTAASEKRADEIAELWRESFDDSEEFISLFMSKVFPCKKTYIAEISGKAVSMATAFECELIVADDVYSCIYLYGVCTKIEYRRRGISTLLLKYIAEHYSDRELFILRPASEELFSHYEKTLGAREAFFTRKTEYTAKKQAVLPVNKISAEKYTVLRESLLTDIPHIRWNFTDTAFAAEIFKQDGGGLYSVGDGFASLSIAGNSINVAELITGEMRPDKYVYSLMKHFGCDFATVYSPIKDKNKAEKSAVCFSEGAFLPECAYLGFDFS